MRTPDAVRQQQWRDRQVKPTRNTRPDHHGRIEPAWSEFVRQLTYKADLYGSKIVTAGRFFASSKTCSVCGTKADKMPLSVRTWTCTECGSVHDRDINAAINLKPKAVQ